MNASIAQRRFTRQFACPKRLPLGASPAMHENSAKTLDIEIFWPPQEFVGHFV